LSTRALSIREGAAPVRDRLMTTLFLAVILHGIVILGVTFGAVGLEERAPGLEVILVREDVPEADRNDSARYLAQRTQLGSGTTDDPVAAESPAAELERRRREGEPIGSEPDALAGAARSRDEPLLATTSPRPDIHYLADAGLDGLSDEPPLLVEASDGRVALGRDGAEEAQLSGPRRDELWITPDTREAILAPYLDLWRHKVERLGTLNFPAIARQASRSTNPVLEVAIDADGRLSSTRIRRSSGSPELDQAAIDILQLASPFDPFPRELATHYRVLRFAYEWQFVGGRADAGRVTAPADSR
jgi:protein TonB